MVVARHDDEVAGRRHQGLGNAVVLPTWTTRTPGRWAVRRVASTAFMIIDSTIVRKALGS